MGKRIRITVELPECLGKKLVALAAEYDYSVASLVRLVLRDTFRVRKGVPRVVGLIMKDPRIYVSALRRRVSLAYLRRRRL